MVHDKVHGVSKKLPSRTSSRRPTRYRPTARVNATTKDSATSNNFNEELWSTIYTLNISHQAQLGNIINNVRSSVSSPFVHGVDEGSTSLSSRSEEANLDKVEDMDIDHHSDHEENSFSSELPGTSIQRAVLPISLPDAKKNVDKAKKEDKKIKEAVKGPKQDKNNKLPSTSKAKKMPLHDSGSASKVVKMKPVYIILHAALVRVGGIAGKALSPVRIQAERILIEMEIKADPWSEVFTLRIPCKELVAIQANLCEPPFLFVVSVNRDYSQHLLNGSKKNGVLSKIKGIDELEIVIQLTYDSMPNNIQQELARLRKDISEDVRWKEISSSQAEGILNNEPYDSTDAANKKKTSPSVKDRKILKAKGNRKNGSTSETEDGAKEEREPAVMVNSIKKEDTSLEPPKKAAKRESLERETLEDRCVFIPSDVTPEKVVNPSRKRSYDNTGSVATTVNELDEKAPEEVEKKEETIKLNTQPSNIVVSNKELIESRRNEKVDEKKCHSSQEQRISSLERQSFEEDRLNMTRLTELQGVIVETEGLSNQRRISLELSELQLEQERNIVGELCGSLREEQMTRRDLETRYEALNGELLARNTRDMLTESRIQDMERELSQLNLTLGNLGTENGRLVLEINEFRRRLAETDENVTSERNIVVTLQQDLEGKRTTLERLREEFQRKDDELQREQTLRAETRERTNQIEQTFASTTEQYEERLRLSNEECTRIGRQYDECSRTLATAREEVQGVNSALRRAQETIEEYSRMQPRDWTISRDEIAVSDKVLGEGGWGWVKEGLFRGTKVAVKQMHELIVSPHNRRLFEREMHMAARCRHPNLLQFIGATNDDDLALLVTELLDTNLRTVLGQRSLCHDEVLTLSLDVSRALNYMHLNKPFPIIHRDISSTNVLLWKREDAWHAKLSDYGAANFMRQCMTVSPGASIYAAPEAMTSRQSTKVDVYSFGMLLCEMCIRELPVPQHTNDQIRLITNAHLRDLVQRCTHTAPENRPTMHDVLSALQHLCSSTTLGMVSVNSRQVVF